MNNAIELTNVTKRFGSQTAVDDVSLSVQEGSIYGFIGPNGSGKTTTLRMILRIIQPDSGTVSVLGQPFGKTADDRLGYLPEERGLYKKMRVRSLLKYYARLKGFYDCQSAIDEWLIRLDAVDWANKRIDALSKGMAQKIQFITAVVARPKLVILDEPFSGLDPVNLDVLREAVLFLREQGTTIVFSTHDMSVAEIMCDTIFMIFQGRKVLDGTLESIQAQYPANRLRFDFADKVDVDQVPGLSGIELQKGQYVAQMESNQSQQVLHHLTQLGPVTHFEIIKPTLQEIFVQIARPEVNNSTPTHAAV